MNMDATDLLQLLDKVDCVVFDFIVGVVKTTLDNLINDMVMACRSKRAMSGEAACDRGEQETRPLTPVGNDGFRFLNLRCSYSKAPDISGPQRGRNIASHGWGCRYRYKEGGAHDKEMTFVAPILVRTARVEMR